MKSKKTTIDIGKELEDHIALKFQLLGYDKARRSRGSGNKGEAGDIAGQDIAVVECKKRETKNITIKEDVWQKLCNEIPLHSERFPIYFLENKNKKRWAVVDVDTLFHLLACYETVQRGDA